ncbi:hypothetical protein F4808DRAFT_442517 [Astrocystis sublimbata]|nr:hypothetical protein F4808DRAFT_442517 [Astrocystis sublimbata]
MAQAPYSDLEVRHLETERSELQPVPNNPDYTLPEPSHTPDTQDTQNTVADKSEIPTSDAQPLAGSDKPGRRLCGLSSRVFYALVALATLVIAGGIVAGAVVGTRARNGSEDHASGGGNADGGDAADPSNDGNTNTHVMSTSQLASANWTDPAGFHHRFVFFQDVTGALVARRWESQNKTWATNNLTDIIARSDSSLSPLGRSTPLASAASTYNSSSERVRLYFITSNNTVSGVAINDLVKEPEAWRVDSIAGNSIQTWPGSQLAASWHRCWANACEGTFTVAFQRLEDAGVMTTNSTEYKNPRLALEANRAAYNTSLALVAERFESDYPRLTMLTETLASAVKGRIQKSSFTGKWIPQEELFSNVNLPVPSPSLQFSLGALPNSDGVVFLILQPNGKVIGEYFRSGFKDMPEIEFRNGPSGVNFSVIATGEDAMFYGISGDEVLAYSIDDSDPSVFKFEGTVYP